MKRLETKQMENVKGGFFPWIIFTPGFFCALGTAMVMQGTSLEQLQTGDALVDAYCD